MSALAHTPAGTSLAAESAGSLAQLASRLDFHRLLDQHGRLLKVETALPQLALIPERMVMKERVGQPFELTLDCLSTSVAFELKRLIGEQVSLRLLQADGSYKPWHGYVLEAAQLGADGGVARYRLVTGPWLSFLALRRDSFVFQDKTALEIVEEVFRDHPSAHWRVDGTDSLRRRSLCVQYRESDLAFVQRLLAEEGLSYHFEHLDGEAAQDAGTKAHAKHVLVITDRAAERIDLGDVRFTSQHPTANLDEQRDAIDAFACEHRVIPNAVTLAAGTTANSSVSPPKNAARSIWASCPCSNSTTAAAPTATRTPRTPSAPRNWHWPRSSCKPSCSRARAARGPSRPGDASG